MRKSGARVLGLLGNQADQYVTFTLSQARRLQSSTASANVVQVDYTVSIPKDEATTLGVDSNSVADVGVTAIQSIFADEMAQAEAASQVSYGVAVSAESVESMKNSLAVTLVTAAPTVAPTQANWTSSPTALRIPSMEDVAVSGSDGGYLAARLALIFTIALHPSAC